MTRSRWHTTFTTAFKMLRQKDCEFKVFLGYIARPSKQTRG